MLEESETALLPKADCDSAQVVIKPASTTTTNGGNNGDVVMMNNNNEDECSVLIDKQINIGDNNNTTTNGNDSTSALQKQQSVELVWRNVTYTVKKNQFNLFRKRNNQSLQLLKNVSGSIKNHQLTAIMGPSGSGKTTLIECLAGRRVMGVSGEILVRGGKKIEIAFCPQKDFLLPQLTVRETVTFVAKMLAYKHRNGNGNGINGDLKGIEGSKKKSNNDINKKQPYPNYDAIKQILHQLGLDSCEKVPIANCSGGQVKRVMIALQLISKPSVLLLDEPTSGLDSSSCLQCCQMLQQLSKSNSQIAIAASIHQPSARIMSNFDYLYILAIGGQCIYSGPSAELVTRLSSFGLHCPRFHSITDYAIEVSMGDHGSEAIERLVNYEHANKQPDKLDSIDDGISVKKIIKHSRNQPYPFFTHVWLLLYRALILISKDQFLTKLRFFAYTFIAFIIILLFGHESGVNDACNEPPKFKELSNVQSVFSSIFGNFSLVFLSLLVIELASKLLTALVFPLEMSVFVKERQAGWYSCGTYFLAKCFADVPFQVLLSMIFNSLIYFQTGQILDVYRFLLYLGNMILLSIIAESIGLTLGALFVNSVQASIFVGAVVSFPSLCLSGFFLPTGSMSPLFQVLSHFNPLKYAFSTAIITLYGFDRCPSPMRNMTWDDVYDTNKDVLEPVMSYLEDYELMPHFYHWLNSDLVKSINVPLGGSRALFLLDLRRDNIWINFGAMCAFVVIWRFIAYLIFLRKANRES